MKTTELKHLAPYLPYRLNCLVPFTSHGKVIEPLVGVKHNEFYVGGKIIDVDVWDFKPILRPLSDLTKEELKNQGFETHIDYLTHEKGNPIFAPYQMVKYLFSQHFDVFGLIDQDLAIDINKI